MKYKAYTDGASRGNPGRAAIGAAIYDESGEQAYIISEYIGDQITNNVAEYKAVLESIQLILMDDDNAEIEIISDSELLVKQLNGQYKVKNEGLKPLHKQIQDLMKNTKITFTHVKREFNTEADALANQALDNEYR